jgi:hypothetical protein
MNEKDNDMKKDDANDAGVTSNDANSASNVSGEDLKRNGENDGAQNADAIVGEKMKSLLNKPKAKPSFFIKKSAKHTIKIDVLTSKEDGRVVSVSKVDIGMDFEKDFSFVDHTELDFTFSVPNYEDMSTYRQRSTSWRRDAQQMIVDKAQLRNHLLTWHLKEWNVPDNDGIPIALTFDENGALSDESVSVVYAMSPTLLDVVMTWFEKEVLLS